MGPNSSPGYLANRLSLYHDRGDPGVPAGAWIAVGKPFETPHDHFCDALRIDP